MRFFSFAFVALFTCPSTGLGQVVSYDAGEAGNPPVAPDPSSQGWFTTISANTAMSPISPDPGTGLNAWETQDFNAAGFGAPCFVYTPMFGSSINNALYSRGYELTAVLRLLPGGTDGISFAWADGFTLTDDRYLIQFEESGADVIAHDFNGGGSYVCPGAMDGNYHHYAMRFVPGGPGTQFIYDGTALGQVTGGIVSPSYSYAGVFFGASHWGGTGTGRFHHVELRYQDDVSATYC